MIEQDQVEFPPEPVRPPGGDRSLAVRIGIIAGAAVLFVVGAVAAMGASPAPPTTGSDPNTDPAATAAPGTTTPSRPDGDHGWRGGPGMGGMRGGMGMPGFHDITITDISDTDVSLKTDDGWKRTITVTSDTKITKGGQTIALTDLAVGDQVRLDQTRNTDGTYTITEIQVVLPTIGGQVTAIEGSTITVTQRDGTTATIHVSGDTAITVDGATSATISDIKVGSFVVAEGAKRSDGSLDAATLHSGFGGRGGHGPGDMDGDHAAPNASPAPSTSAG
jgi:hypothetical protein